MNAQQYASVISAVGVPIVFHKTKGNQTYSIPKAGVSTPKTDSPIANSYGVGAKIITVLASSIPGVTPEKFDSAVINESERVSFEAVQPVHEPGTGATIGWRCIAKGK